jgi:lactoylglutathione lyase
MTSIEDHARTAVELATANVAAGQFPFAALVVADGGAGEVIATGVNRCRRDADPAAHGEVEAIRAACRRLGTFDLSGAIVVSSCHPCPICQALAGMTGISRIAYAATREEAADGGFGFSDAMASVLDQVDGVMVELEHVAVESAAAPFEAWTASGHPWETNARPIHELRVAVTASDHGAAVAFYRDALGLPQLADWTSPDGKVVVLDGGRGTLELIDEAQAGYIDSVEVGRRVAGQVRLALEVDDSAQVAERARMNGAVVLGKGPVETPWGDRNVRLSAPADLQLTLFTKVDEGGTARLGLSKRAQDRQLPARSQTRSTTN